MIMPEEPVFVYLPVLASALNPRFWHTQFLQEDQRKELATILIKEGEYRSVISLKSDVQERQVAVEMHSQVP